MRKNAVLTRILQKKIRKYRKEAGLTQEELADKVGIGRVYMGYIEQGRNVPSLEVLEKIARILKVKPSDLVP